MSKTKGNTPMHTEPITDTITDRSAILSLQAVKGYVEKAVTSGRAEYNAGSILVKSQHPLDQCLRRGIIEDRHHEIGKRLRNYRDCAVSKLSGRAYNATGEGDSEMDAATIYARLMREMSTTETRRRHWNLVKAVCFADPNIDGKYFSEREYGMLFGLAPNLQYALETTDSIIQQLRKVLAETIARTSAT